MNPSTRAQRDSRFGSGEREMSGGRSRTRSFAKAQAGRFGIDRSFCGSILDFGCGLGDAIPPYRREWPLAQLCGVDFSIEAIRRARALYGEEATFIQSTHHGLPFNDVIVASNVVEHVTEDEEMVEALRDACRLQFVAVPYRKALVPGSEHVHSYDRGSFKHLGAKSGRPCASHGWSEFGLSLWYEVYGKNVVRPLVGRPMRRR